MLRIRISAVRKGRSRSILGWAFVVLVLVVAVVVLVKAHGSADYWAVAVPGVLTGCGTLALAGVTYRVLLGDQEDRRKRDRQDDRRAEQERRAQASRVQVTEAQTNGWTGQGDGYYDLVYRARMDNRSDDAIGEVQLMFVVTPDRARQGRVDQPVCKIGRMTAGESAEPQMTVRLHAHGSSPVPHEVLVWLTFRDAAGVLWARDPSHRLIEITDAEAERLARQAERGMDNGLDAIPVAVEPQIVGESGWGLNSNAQLHDEAGQ